MSEQKKQKFAPEDIERRDWRFGMHLPVGPQGQDLHLVKEIITTKEGKQHPNMRVVPEFKRPVWSTKLQYRTYTDKKEYEHVDKLDMHMVTQSELPRKVAALTGNMSSQKTLSELLASPYIYGGDIPSTVIMHREMYQIPNEGKAPIPYRTGAFDTETDVLYGTEQIIIGSMTVLPYVHLVIRKDFLQYSGPDLDERISAIMYEKFGDLIEEEKLQITYEMVDTEIEIVEKSFQWFHHHMPDWMAIWNIDFDATKILQACKRAGVDPTQILCDPRIPHEYRIAKYKRAQQNKVAASGKGKPVSSHDQWNFMFLTASFTMVDAMSAYRLLRLGDQEERSYGLDAILEKEFKGKIKKLKHPPADMYVKEKWHQVMQRDHKFVYLAYAAMDTISMCLLDRKTRDLSHKLPAMADLSDFSQCNSQPKRLRDAFYIFAKDDHNSIVGSVGYTRDKKEVIEEVDLGDYQEEGFGSSDGDDDEEEVHTTLSRVGWTLTLASHYSAPGLRLIDGAPEITTGIRAFVYDSDAVSSYPSCTQVGNVSKVTTRKEICSVDGCDEQKMRMQNLNLMFSETNACEYTTNMFSAPSLMKLLDIYDRQQADGLK